MSHHIGQSEKKKDWLKLVSLFNVITWRDLGNTNKKRIQKLKERVEPDKIKEKGEKEERRQARLNHCGACENFKRSIFIFKY